VAGASASKLGTAHGQVKGKVEAMSGKPVVRMAELEIDPGTLEAYRALLTEEIEASVALEDGVLSLNAVSIKDRPNMIRILEVYADRQAYEAHLRTPHFLKYKNETAGMVTSLTLIDVEPIVMRSKP
jgi:quinol monooxygenase YgiN